ncbi:hypothetical protein P8452_01443 [Trifolium repens]|nr:hypothetical protein P8452_01443 [Trifolium repens]
MQGHIVGILEPILLQDHVGGLQILHKDMWIDIPPTPEALIINIGDLLQLITNDRFKSAHHRVLSNGDLINSTMQVFNGSNSETFIGQLS